MLGFGPAPKEKNIKSGKRGALCAKKENPGDDFWSWRMFDGFTPCIEKMCSSLLSLDGENLQLSVKIVMLNLTLL